MARSAAPKDRREYIRVSVDMPLNPKLMSLDEAVIPLAGWLAVNAFCYCGANRTDGEFAPGAVYRMAGVGPDVGKELIAIGMWHEPGHDCPKCPQPGERKVISHDYLEHQRSKAEIQELQDKRTAAGAKGAEARWSAKRAGDSKKARVAADPPTEVPPIASGIASAIAKGWQDDGKAMAEVEVEVEVEELKDQTPSVAADAATDGVTSIHGSKAPGSPKQRAGKAAPDDALFESGAESQGPAYTEVQILVAAYSDALTAAGGIAASTMTGPIGRNLKTLLEKDHIAPAVLLVAAQRAGAARAKNVDRFLGAVQKTFDRAGQGREAMHAEWDRRAALIDATQAQIGA